MISTARLNGSLRVHLQPINVLVLNYPDGILILWPASHLDAFSAYLFPTWLPCNALGSTAGALTGLRYTPRIDSVEKSLVREVDDSPSGKPKGTFLKEVFG